MTYLGSSPKDSNPQPPAPLGSASAPRDPRVLPPLSAPLPLTPAPPGSLRSGSVAGSGGVATQSVAASSSSINRARVDQRVIRLARGRPSRKRPLRRPARPLRDHEGWARARGGPTAAYLGRMSQWRGGVWLRFREGCPTPGEGRLVGACKVHAPPPLSMRMRRDEKTLAHAVIPNSPGGGTCGARTSIARPGSRTETCLRP